jgi:hypothetical protein
MQMQMPMRRNLPVQTGGAVNNGFHMEDVRKGAWLAGECQEGMSGRWSSWPEETSILADRPFAYCYRWGVVWPKRRKPCALR